MSAVEYKVPHITWECLPYHGPEIASSIFGHIQAVIPKLFTASMLLGY